MKLSQCMIVKNEEKNIETALGWAKDITFEQIVVDTGSTDNTVELAKKLGAKVCHFEWINNFAAAKNYAIEQATGDWIAFLDADEYLSSEDIKKLIKLLKQIDSDTRNKKIILGIVTPWVNVDDNGKPMTIASQVRIFRNDPSIRYQGRVHESLSIYENKFIDADDISIIHTGYSESSHIETGKAERNIKLLRSELEEKPDDINLKAYLANDLSMASEEDMQKEAEILFLDVMKSNEKISAIHRIKALLFLVTRYSEQPDKLDACEEMCRKTLIEFPGAIDVEYLLADTLSKKGDYKEAWNFLKSCEDNITQNSNHKDSIMIPADPTILFSKMVLTAKQMSDFESVVFYSTKVLTMDKTRSSILGSCITMLLMLGITDDEIIGLISNIYDFSDCDDLEFIINTANEYGARDFAVKIQGFLEANS